MPKVSDIIAFLEEFAPPELSEGWDNTGLLIGRRDSSVERLLACLTLTPDVAQEAISKQVQFVVTHHPVLFRGAKRIADDCSEGRMLLSLIERGVAVYSPHTSFDSAAGGINQQLAASFGLSDITPIRPSLSVGSGEVGSGRFGVLSPELSMGEFLPIVCQAVAATHLEYSEGRTDIIRKVAVACGAAADFLADAIQSGCDTFITGEARFHSALEARTAGLNLILLGHYSSERPAVESLAQTLAAKFSTLEIWSSRIETDPLKVYQP